jgi:hypothetical protein
MGDLLHHYLMVENYLCAVTGMAHPAGAAGTAASPVRPTYKRAFAVSAYCFD